MDRHNFVVLYTKKDDSTIYCLSCEFERKERPDMLQRHGHCNCNGTNIWHCTAELFDNTKHVPVTTRNKCTLYVPNDILNVCHRCVLNERYEYR